MTVDDWDLFEKMFEYVYRHCLKEDTTLHPIMFSEVSVSFILESFFFLLHFFDNSGIRINVVNN